ncbi:MAG: hypothetical protein GY938_12520 [Ketobacter sp.]|nr:hypothetical protein [Ketobacter sp.]
MNPLTNKRNQKIIDDGYGYRFHSKSEDNTKLYWRCDKVK